MAENFPNVWEETDIQNEESKNGQNKKEPKTHKWSCSVMYGSLQSHGL